MSLESTHEREQSPLTWPVRVPGTVRVHCSRTHVSLMFDMQKRSGVVHTVGGGMQRWIVPPLCSPPRLWSSPLIEHEQPQSDAFWHVAPLAEQRPFQQLSLRNVHGRSRWPWHTAPSHIDGVEVGVGVTEYVVLVVCVVEVVDFVVFAADVVGAVVFGADVVDFVVFAADVVDTVVFATDVVGFVVFAAAVVVVLTTDDVVGPFVGGGGGEPPGVGGFAVVGDGGAWLGDGGFVMCGGGGGALITTPLSTRWSIGEPDDSLSEPSSFRNESTSSCTAPSGGTPPYIVQISVMLQPLTSTQKLCCEKQSLRKPPTSQKQHRHQSVDGQIVVEKQWLGFQLARVKSFETCCSSP